MDGILPMYKPAGITSFDVIRQVKQRLERGQKIGHAGTLDPFADGVLLLILGKATKRFGEIQTWKKMYKAVARLGYCSNTLDREGEISKSVKQLNNVSMAMIQKEADKFVGEIEQVIPQYSAAKYRGKPLYKYARKGEVVPQKSKQVTIYSIKVNNYHYSNNGSYVEMEVACGSGTYIRQLSYDIMQSLGIDSYLDRLTRIQIGEIGMSDCNKLDSGEVLKIWER